MKQKIKDDQKKRLNHKLGGVNPEAGRKAVVGKIWGKGIGFEPGVKE